MGDAHDWACLFEDLSRAFPEAGPRAEIRALVEEAGRRRKRSRADVRRAMKGFLPLVEPLTRWAPAPARGGRPARVRRKPAGR